MSETLFKTNKEMKGSKTRFFDYTITDDLRKEVEETLKEINVSV